MIPAIRLPFITKPLLGFYTKILPPLSETERTALEAGDPVGIDPARDERLPELGLLARPGHALGDHARAVGLDLHPDVGIDDALVADENLHRAGIPCGGVRPGAAKNRQF